jgi:hypothetical protein
MLSLYVDCLPIAMYLVFLLLGWLCVRVVRRFKVHARQQDRMSEARCESYLLRASQAEHRFHE